MNIENRESVVIEKMSSVEGLLKEMAIQYLQKDETNRAMSVVGLIGEISVLREKFSQFIKDDNNQIDKRVETSNIVRERIDESNTQERRYKEDLGRRAERGERTTEEDFKPFILKALVGMGGRGRTSDVVQRARADMEKLGMLTKIDYDLLPKTGHERWYITACYARKHMIKESLLADNSERGYWEITELGRDYLKKSEKV